MSATVYMVKPSGARSCSVEVGRLRVLVEPGGAIDNQAAVELAERIERYEVALAAARKQLANAREDRERLESKLRELGARNQAALTGRRRFFGPVVMVPADPATGWSGPVLLLDAEKQYAGRCLEFASAAEVHRAHPELWVVGSMGLRSAATDVVGVVLDAWGVKGGGR